MCSTYAAKAILASVGFLFLLGFIGLGLLEGEAILIVLAYISVVGSVLAPAWYFQAMEKPYITASIDITLRLASIPLLLSLVKSSLDGVIALAVTTGTQLCIGIVGLIALIQYGRVRWYWPSAGVVVTSLRAGLPLFASTSVISLYTTTTSVVVGVLAGREQLGYFTAAQKIVLASAGVLVPISQAVYPRISSAFARDPSEGAKLARLVLKISVPAGVAITLLLWWLADWITNFVFGSQFEQAGAVIRMLSPVPLLLSFIIVCANLVMVPLGQDSSHLRMVSLAAIAHLVTVFPLVNEFAGRGAAAAVVIAELIVVIYSGLSAYRLLRKVQSRPKA